MDKFLGVGLVNLLGIFVLFIIFIVLLKTVVIKFPVPGVTEIVSAV